MSIPGQSGIASMGLLSPDVLTVGQGGLSVDSLPEDAAAADCLHQGLTVAVPSGSRNRSRFLATQPESGLTLNCVFFSWPHTPRTGWEL